MLSLCLPGFNLTTLVFGCNMLTQTWKIHNYPMMCSNLLTSCFGGMVFHFWGLPGLPHPCMFFFESIAFLGRCRVELGRTVKSWLKMGFWGSVDPCAWRRAKWCKVTKNCRKVKWPPRIERSDKDGTSVYFDAYFAHGFIGFVFAAAKLWTATAHDPMACRWRPLLCQVFICFHSWGPRGLEVLKSKEHIAV